MSLYWGASHTIRAISRILWRAQATGVEHVPLDGPLIVACNHVSYLDPPVMGSFCPRQIHFMAKKQLFDIPVLGAAIRAVGAYPVDREGTPTAAIKRSVEVLRTGGCIGIFPEGTRNLEGDVEARQGVALLASLGKAPVVPACIVGSNHARSLGKIKVAFGTPLRLPSDRKATRDDLAKFTDDVMSAIRALAENIGGNS
ncbi:MAG TPA: lysophospholipid acyltransferase family protein [Candidatus Dormibacteraeota bacterium]|nr:lysophospholipid acyltransferase family protein [Candidatus Dormibacteraeota bacterium]